MPPHRQGHPGCGCSPHPDTRPDPRSPCGRWKALPVPRRRPVGDPGGVGFGGASMGRSTSAQTSAATAASVNTMLNFWNLWSTSSRSAARWASCTARRRAAAALARLARRSQRSTHRAALGPMVSDAMSRMRSSSTNPMRIGRFPLFWWLFLSNQYSTLYSREASRRQAPAVSCGAFVVY